MKHSYYLITILIFLSCKEPKTKYIIYKSIQKQDLLGTWSQTPTGSPTFKLDETQLYFLEEEPGQKLPYSILGDSIYFQFENYTSAYKIQMMEGDSMRFITEQSQTTYFKIPE
ncbi:MAG: hypothetical protein IPO78_01000 [Saprospiraceae bacterium]|nr:hypothetical protein [Saprospiraceae bacterium]